VIEFAFAPDHGSIVERHFGFNGKPFLLLLLFNLPTVLSFELVEKSLDLRQFSDCLTVFALNWSLIVCNLLVPVHDLFDTENLLVLELSINQSRGVTFYKSLVRSLLLKSRGVNNLFRRRSLMIRSKFDIFHVNLVSRSYSSEGF